MIVIEQLLFAAHIYHRGIRHCIDHYEPPEQVFRSAVNVELLNRLSTLRATGNVLPAVVSNCLMHVNRSFPKQKILQSDHNKLSRLAVSLDIFDNISSFKRLCNVIAYCKRFVYNVKNKEQKQLGNLTLSEIRQAELIIIRKDQVKKVLKECVRCYKVNPIASTQIMGNLPLDRISVELLKS
ncbi:hypothetical protein PPYR_09985 [Photinus pyralis]|uniref:Uncharacterized protein n=1 Tax=Photinus pyralis TaxID=7054 RepID=A0A5N4AF38_PHOPY|nr:hypothetical protein PPYR_09985 [Photinus pyralis]